MYEAQRKTWPATPTSPRVAVIYHIIMNQACGVDHLCYLCQPPLLFRNVTVRTAHTRSVHHHRVRSKLATACTCAHLRPMSSAVALATRNTIAGRNFFPPAPKI